MEEGMDSDWPTNGKLEYCAHIFTETRLQHNIPDQAAGSAERNCVQSQ